MEVIWTKHARERQQQWEMKQGLSREEVEAVVKTPEQVVPGDQEVLIAQARRGTGLLRVPFVETQGRRKILTLYWTSQVARYWKDEHGDAI